MKAITAILVFLIVLTLPLLVSAANGDIMTSQERPQLEKAVSDTGQCVKDIEYMRANHMNVLRNERERAVRLGVRTQEHGINNCFTCHKHKSEFCDKCHEYAGVNPGCFGDTGGCHNAPE